jgi:hypothetical protein
LGAASAAICADSDASAADFGERARAGGKTTPEAEAAPGALRGMAEMIKKRRIGKPGDLLRDDVLMKIQ